MELEFIQGMKHTNADMLSRMNCGTCIQCLTDHEDPKIGKLKTRIINGISNSTNYKWQNNVKEIEKIKENIRT